MVRRRPNSCKTSAPAGLIYAVALVLFAAMPVMVSGGRQQQPQIVMADRAGRDHPQHVSGKFEG